MSLYRRGEIWWSRLEWRGQVIQRSTKLRNKNDARDVEAAWRASLAKGEAGITDFKTTPTLKEFQPRFLAYLPAHVAPGTAAFYKTSLDALIAFRSMATARLNHIDSDLIDRFVQHRLQSGLNPGTVNNSLRVLRRVLHLARDWHLLLRVPKIKMLPGERSREFIFDDETLDRFLSQCSKINTLWLLVRVLVDTGMRLSEALNLTWDRVGFDPKDGASRGFIFVNKGKSKFARRYIPLTATAAACITECRNRSRCNYVFTTANGRRRMSRQWASEQFHAIRERLGLPWDCVIHSCRHTFCTRLGERGADAFTIQKLAGHSSIVISQRYVHPTPQRLENAIGLLESHELEVVQD